MDGEIRMLVPPYLQELGYCDIISIQKLSDKCFANGKWHPYWVEWRGIFEYLACVEYSFQCISNLPKGIQLIYNHYDLQAKYHTSSLVFHSQAVLDIIAVWLKDKYTLKVKGSNISFSKAKFKNEIITKNNLFVKFYDKHEKFIYNLSSNRMEWVHRVVNGTMVGGDKRPTDIDFSDENIHVLVPMDPSINLYTANIDELQRKMNKIKNAHGMNSYKVEEFSDLIIANIKSIIFAIIEMILPLFG